MNIKTLVIVIFLVGLVGIIGVYFGTKIKSSSTVITPSPVPTQPLVGNDRDKHGCIPSAGYSWCEVKQKCLRTWEEPCDGVTIAPTPTVDETAILKTVIKQLLVAKHGSSANELTISVSKIQGLYSPGGASASGGGGMWLAAKGNGVW